MKSERGSMRTETATDRPVFPWLKDVFFLFHISSFTFLVHSTLMALGTFSFSSAKAMTSSMVFT